MIYDVKQHHHDIAAIREHMNLAPLAPETSAGQRDMLSMWGAEKEAFYERIFWNPDRLAKWKLARLSTLVDFAFRTSPFYRRLYKTVGYAAGGIRSYDDFEQLPVITKDDVIANFPDGMPSDAHALAECRWMSTSGSSGKQIQIVLPQRRADLDVLFKYRMFEFMGGFRLTPDRWLYNIHYCIWWHTSMMGQHRVFSVTQDCDAEAVLAHIARLRPVVVSAVGSYVEKLAAMGMSLRTLGVRLVSTNSETTTPEERRRWSRVFDVPVRDEYSSEELDLLAMECPHGHYHAVEDDSHLEIQIFEKGRPGRVIGTDLWNTAMPMIRYDQGDLAEWEDGDQCPCGSGFRRIKHLHGRADQAFFSRINGIIAPASLLDAVEETLCSPHSNVREFRVIQEDLDRIRLLYVPQRSNESVSSEALLGLQGRLDALFGHAVSLHADALSSIPEASSFKRRTLINTLPSAREQT